MVSRLICQNSVFVHVKDIKNGKALNVGDAVSYRFASGNKGASAKGVTVETAADVVDAVSNERVSGNVKVWREEKGFGFIGRDDGRSEYAFPYHSPYLHVFY